MSERSWTRTVALLVLCGAVAGCELGSWSHEDLVSRSARYPGDPKWIDERALRTSIRLAAEHLCEQQLPSGLFRYEYDVVTGKENRRNNMVRQVGAYWALALLLSHPEARLEPALRARVEQTFTRMDGWIERRMRDLPGFPGARYPDIDDGAPTGGVALVALGLVERVAAGDRSLQGRLDEVLAFLVASRAPEGGFRDQWDEDDRRFGSKQNPYADGEALLALAKNRVVLGDRRHDAVIESAAKRLKRRWFGSRATDDRKGFYQWGTMAFYWISRARPAEARAWQDAILEYADWMVLEHRTLSRTRNTSYAVEGLATAFGVARARHDRVRIRSLRHTILKTHARVISAQIGHPLNRHNPFVKGLATARRESKRLHGGFLNGHADPAMRIDVTQHAIHSILLTLEHGVLP